MFRIMIRQRQADQLGTPASKSAPKRTLKIRQVWSIRFFQDREGRIRDRALFDLDIDSKLRGCDLVKIKSGILVAGPAIRARSMVIRPCSFGPNPHRAALLGSPRQAYQTARTGDALLTDHADNDRDASSSA